MFFNGQKKSPQFERAFRLQTHTQNTERAGPFFTPPSLMASSSSLRADQLRMKGLQLDDVSMKKLELDMREEVMNIFELQMQIFL
jgi:UDP-N-acetylenolpyruvoylglucosamine reductase